MRGRRLLGRQSTGDRRLGRWKRRCGRGLRLSGWLEACRRRLLGFWEGRQKLLGLCHRHEGRAWR